jgi:sterol 3beta-glucosyltransferase
VRAVLTNLGSLGDIQPFVALAQELRRHDHSPVLALAPAYRAYAGQLGFEFVPIGLDLDYAQLQRKDTEDALRGADLFQNFSASLKILSNMLPQMFSELREACRNADVLISGNLQPASRMLHELSGTPFVSLHTNHFAGMQPPAYRLAAGAAINPFREQHGLPALEDPVHMDANSPQLTLYAISRYLRTPDPKWPSHYHVTGFFFVEEKEWQPPLELIQFLESGDPPVIIGFSSIVHSDPQAITDLLLEAIRLAGCRAVIQHGWSGLAKDRDLPPSVLSIGFAQHTWLLPHAACVVHAGGSGTTAATLRSGVPGIFVPHIGDQPMWAALVRGLGCARDTIPYSELTSERLAAAISRALSDPELSRQAADMAAKIRAEQGVSRARLLIEQLHGDQNSQLVPDDAGAHARKQLQQRLRFRKSRLAANADLTAQS